MQTDSLINLQNHIESLLGITNRQIEQAQRRSLRAQADEWELALSTGLIDAGKMEKIHLEMLLGLLKNELEKTAENSNLNVQAKSAA